jgi:hypothetical protein
MKYLKLSDIPKHYPVQQSTLRYWLAHNTCNFKKIALKVGGRIVVKIETFDKWLDSLAMEQEPTEIEKLK